MFRRVLQFVSLTSLAGLCLFYPLLESMDPWDSPVPATDAEIQFIALLTFVGIMFVLAHVLATVGVFSFLNWVVEYLRQRATAALAFADRLFRPLLTPSPPLPLRI